MEKLLFRREEWIGCGKKIDQLPQSVLEAIARELEMPATVIDKLPSDGSPVGEFLRWNGRYLKGVQARPLLTERAISIIKKCSLRAWLDGYQSLDDSRYANSRLPLQAVAVLDRLSLVEKGAARCYDVAIHGFATTARALQLTSILSADWLNDELIDLLVDLVEERRKRKEAAGETVPKDVMVAPVHFGSRLAGFLERRKNNPKEPIALPSGKDLSYLKKFAGPTRQRPKPTFVFIWNVDQLHWVTVKVDFASGKVPSGGPPSE